MSVALVVVPTLPKPEAVTLGGVAAFIDSVIEVRAWCRTERDVGMAEEIRRRLAALERYVKDRESRSALAAEQRRTEVLIGELLGPAEWGGDRTQVAPQQLAEPRRRHEFRTMAGAADMVEALIAEGVTSRPRILQRLKPKEVAAATMPTGVYATIVADPPWRYGNTATRGAAEDHYPTMTADELGRLSVEVDEWAAPGCHLYLWTTNNFIREAFDVIDAWGFDYKTLLTWVKPQIGMGNYFRSRTEHVLFATRGGLGTERRDISNVIEANRTQHSRKPEAFYDLAEAQSPGPYLEMFSRRRRLGWDNWGNEA